VWELGVGTVTKTTSLLCDAYLSENCGEKAHPSKRYGGKWQNEGFFKTPI